MKIFTSYFYQIRNFKPYMIPLSTAKWDPKWYSGYGNIYLDKNNVYNGLRIEPLVPDHSCIGLCRGVDKCPDKDPNNCQFLKNYRNQLNKINCNELVKDLSQLDVINLTDHETYVILIFHEAPDNLCSEREVVKRWFKDNNFNVEELFFE